MGYIRLRKIEYNNWWVYSKDCSDRYIGTISTPPEGGFVFHVPPDDPNSWGLMQKGYSWEEACNRAQKASVYADQKWDISE